MCAIEEILLVVIAAAILARPGLLARTVRLRSQARSLASLLAAPVVVIAATAAVMTPAWAGSEGPAGMASSSGGSSSSSMASSAGSLQGGMGDMGSTNGQPDMQMYGSTNAPTAAQVEAATNLIKETDASLVRFENVNNAIAAGYTYRLATNGEEHLLYAGGNPAYQGLNPQDPSSLVYATNVKGHAPILLGDVPDAGQREWAAGRRRADPLALAPGGLPGRPDHRRRVQCRAPRSLRSV